MRKRNRKNNGRNSETLALELYKLIMDDDEIRDIANKFCDEDEIVDFVERAWEGDEDSYIDLVEDILDDTSMTRGFSPRRFLPAMAEWLKDNFDYHDGDIGMILEDIGELCANASKETLEAYTGVTIICGNIMRDYDLESNNDVAAMATIHSLRAAFKHIKNIGDNESYMAASSSTEEPEKPSKSEEKKDSKKTEDKKESNTSNINVDELKDKIDVESIAQNIYSEVKDSGKLEEMIMQGIIEGLRQVVDGGKMTSDTEEEIINKINDKSGKDTNTINDAIKIAVNEILKTMGGNDKSYENIINRLRNKNDSVIDVEEDELKEVTDVIPVGKVVDRSNEVNKEKSKSDNNNTTEFEQILEESGSSSKSSDCGHKLASALSEAAKVTLSVPWVKGC